MVFAAEFFFQLRNRGIDLRPRLPGFPGQGQTGWKDTGQNLKHQICGTAHCRARSRMASTLFHRPRFPAQNHSLPKSVGRITPTTRRRPFRDVTTHLHPMVSPLSTPAILENPRSKRHDTTIFVERLQNRSSSSVVPTSNPPTLTPAVPNPEARPKKSSRRCVPPPPESVPTGTGTPLVTLLALQKNTMILLQTMVFLLIVLQPRQLLQLLPLLTLLALFVNRIMNHLCHIL